MPHPTHEARAERWTVEQYIPGAIAWQFLRDPALIQKVEREGDGYRVTRTSSNGRLYPPTLPNGITAEQRTLVYHIDAGGKVVRVDNVWKDGSAREYDYADAALAKVGVVREAARGTKQLIDSRIDSKANPKDFERGSVESLAVGLHLIADYPAATTQGSSAVPKSFAGPPAVVVAPERAAQSVGSVPSSFAQRTWRWWAAGTGIGVIVLALWLRRRMA